MMRSVGTKDKSSLAAPLLHRAPQKKAKFTNAGIQFQSQAASQESTLRASRVYTLNVALVGSAAVTSNQLTETATHLENVAHMQMLSTFPRWTPGSFQYHSQSYPIAHFMENQAQSNRSVASAIVPFGSAAAAAVATTPASGASWIEPWSPTLLLREAANMVVPVAPMFAPVIVPLQPFRLSCESDRGALSVFQVFLRLQIEAFGATRDDANARIPGRVKRIQLGQVGIRCRHCAHVIPSHRTKGSVYFPASTLGVYQAAQNMCATHLQCGLCPEMPESIQALFTQLLSTKTTKSSSMGGRAYWSQCVIDMGLIDTEQGIFPRHGLPNGVHPLDPLEQTLYQDTRLPQSARF